MQVPNVPNSWRKTRMFLNCWSASVNLVGDPDATTLTLYQAMSMNCVGDALCHVKCVNIRSGKWIRGQGGPARDAECVCISSATMSPVVASLRRL